MGYLRETYNDLEEQKRTGSSEGKTHGTLEGAQQAFIMSFFVYLVLFLGVGMSKQNDDAPDKYPHEFFLLIYHVIIIVVSAYFLVRAVHRADALIGNFDLAEVRTRGTNWAYSRSWNLHRNHYQGIWLNLIILLNSVVYGIIMILIHSLNPGGELFKNEESAIIVMTLINLAFVIFTSVLRR